MGAGGLQALVKSGLVSSHARSSRGSGPLLLAVAAYLKKSGAKVLTIAEQAPASRVRGFAAKFISHPRKFGKPMPSRRTLGFHINTEPGRSRAGGAEKLEWVELMRTERKRSASPAIFLACGFHLVPNTGAAAPRRCTLREGFVRSTNRNKHRRQKYFLCRRANRNRRPGNRTHRRTKSLGLRCGRKYSSARECSLQNATPRADSQRPRRSLLRCATNSATSQLPTRLSAAAKMSLAPASHSIRLAQRQTSNAVRNGSVPGKSLRPLR